MTITSAERHLVSCVIVNWNTRDLLLQCVDALPSALGNIPHEIIVVDNASSDGSTDAIRTRYPGMCLIANQQNSGFAAGVNDGIKKARGHYLLILNPDIIPSSESIQSLIHTFKHDDHIGMVSPELVNPDGSSQLGYVYKYPSLMQVLLFHTVLNSWASGQDRLARRYYQHVSTKSGGWEEVQILAGACMFVKREVIDSIGLMDERFHLFYEDVDWCYRMIGKGWKLVVDHDVVWKHIGGQSFTVGDRSWVYARFEMSVLAFIDKHGTFVQRAISKLILLVNGVVMAGVNRFLLFLTADDKRTAREQKVTKYQLFLNAFWRKYIQRDEAVR